MPEALPGSMHCTRCTPPCVLGWWGGLPNFGCAVAVLAVLLVATRTTKSRARLLTRQCAHTNDSNDTRGSASCATPRPAHTYRCSCMVVLQGEGCGTQHQQWHAEPMLKPTAAVFGDTVASSLCSSDTALSISLHKPGGVKNSAACRRCRRRCSMITETAKAGLHSPMSSAGLHEYPVHVANCVLRSRSSRLHRLQCTL